MTDTLFKDIKIALADMREAHEDIDIARPGFNVVCGYRFDGQDTQEAIELYRAGEHEPIKTVYVVTDRYNPFDEVLDRAVRIIASVINAARRPL